LPARRRLDLVVPLLLLAAATLLFRVTDLDLSLEERLYAGGAEWSAGAEQPWLFLYEHGPKPSIAIGVASLAVFLAGFRIARLRVHRRTALFLFLALVLGPGLVVNTLFRDEWGRPRPRDLVRFGGESTYWKVWEHRPGGEGHSFPSGHAAAAFYLFVPCFPLWRRHPAAARVLLLVGLAYGLFMGWARMAQGGHFASDVVWSAGFTYLTALGLWHLLQRKKGEASDGRDKEEGDS